MTLKKQNDLSMLTRKISHKSVLDKFDEADAVLDAEKINGLRERVIRKSYALTKQDLEKISSVKDKCLNQKVVLSDSQVVRLALELATKLSEAELIEASSHLQKVSIGRPKGS